jgi:hypothetical protein
MDLRLSQEIQNTTNLNLLKEVKMSNLMKHAQREFEVAGWTKDGVFKDDMQKLMCEQVLELLSLFGSHGHSGSSAPYAINLFTKLALFESITPLTGADSEWNDLGNNCFQNNRASNVFKGNGVAYQYDAIIFRDKEGVCYTNSKSRKGITFPYTPSHTYVDI